jgi:hypothetical protein
MTRALSSTAQRLRCMGLRAAAEIGTSQLAKGDLRDVVIEVRDERRQRVFTVTASMTIERHTPLSLVPYP